MWKVTKKGDPTGTIYAAKLYRNGNDTDFFRNERDMMLRIGNNSGYSNIIDSYEDEDHGNIIVMTLIKGDELTNLVTDSMGELIPRDDLIDTMV